jgi:hypothetical protein
MVKESTYFAKPQMTYFAPHKECVIPKEATHYWIAS